MAEEASIDLTIKTGDAEKNTQSLKARLRELKQELLGLDEGSAEFTRIAAEAGRLQDRIGDVNRRVNNLASDTRRLDTFVGVAQGIAGGFAAAQGAIALFGSENEELNKTLVKVQGSVALLTGVQQIANTLQAESAVVTGVSTMAQAAYAVVVGTSTGALKLFRLALSATGIGLIVIAIIALVENWDNLTSAISGSTEELDKNIEKTKEHTKAMQEQSKALQQQAKDDLAMALAGWEQIRAIREQQGLDTLEADKKIREIRLLQGATEAELNVAQKKEETAKIIEELKERERQEKELADQKQKEREEKEKEYADKMKDIREEQAKEEADIAKMREAQRLEDKKEADDAIQAQIEQANAQAIRAKRDLDRQEAIEDAKALERDKIMQQARANLQTQGLTFAKSIATLAIKDARKNAIAMRAIALVELAINTATSISNAIKGATQSASATGVGAVVATPLFIASQIATVLAAAAQAAVIIGAPLPKAEGGSAPVAPGVPDNPFGNSETNQNNAPGIPQSPQSIPIPQPVYVTETDITGVQNQVQVIEGLSKIG